MRPKPVDLDELKACIDESHCLDYPDCYDLIADLKATRTERDELKCMLEYVLMTSSESTNEKAVLTTETEALARALIAKLKDGESDG